MADLHAIRIQRDELNNAIKYALSFSIKYEDSVLHLIKKARQLIEVLDVELAPYDADKPIPVRK